MTLMSNDHRLPRILVVDDEAVVRQFVERVLRDTGYEVAVAPGGPEALAIADEQSPFDLFVIDVRMPDMSGDELARRLRQRFQRVEVLFFTAHSDLLFEDRAALEAHEAFLDKPVTMKGLLEAVSLILFGHTRGPSGNS